MVPFLNEEYGCGSGFCVIIPRTTRNAHTLNIMRLLRSLFWISISPSPVEYLGQRIVEVSCVITKKLKEVLRGEKTQKLVRSKTSQ